MQWLAKHGIEAEARILRVEVVDEPGRYLPFVKLLVAVTPFEATPFIACVASLFHPIELLPALTKNANITIRYNPSNISQLQVVKKPQPVQHKETIRWQPISTKNSLSRVQ